MYKINEDLKVQFRILVSIGNEQIPHSRGICLQVKYKLKFVLIYYVEVKQQIWINVQKVEDLKLQSRKYDLQARIVASTYDLSRKTILIPFKIHDELTKNTGCHSTTKKDFHARIICNEPPVHVRAFLCKIRQKKPR